jgi:hypothetical protein
VRSYLYEFETNISQFKESPDDYALNREFKQFMRQLKNSQTSRDYENLPVKRPTYYGGPAQRQVVLQFINTIMSFKFSEDNLGDEFEMMFFFNGVSGHSNPEKFAQVIKNIALKDFEFHVLNDAHIVSPLDVKTIFVISRTELRKHILDYNEQVLCGEKKINYVYGCTPLNLGTDLIIPDYIAVNPHVPLPGILLPEDAKGMDLLRSYREISRFYISDIKSASLKAFIPPEGLVVVAIKDKTLPDIRELIKNLNKKSAADRRKKSNKGNKGKQ